MKKFTFKAINGLFALLTIYSSSPTFAATIGEPLSKTMKLSSRFGCIACHQSERTHVSNVSRKNHGDEHRQYQVLTTHINQRLLS